MVFCRCSLLLVSIGLVVGVLGCSSSEPAQTRLVEPQSYVYLDASHGWGHIVTLRIVDWGDPQIHISVTDHAGREKIGYLSRAEYRQLIAELQSLRAFDLGSFTRDNVCDADIYRVDICDRQRQNRISIYCPWQNAADADTPAMYAAGNSRGSKPHADLVRRLLDEAERDSLRWDVCTFSFHPGRHLVDTERADVEDVYFADDGELMYATTEDPKWVGGSADEENGCVVWHSVDKQIGPLRVPFDVIDGGNNDGPGPRFPRPSTVANAEFPELPTIEYFEVEQLAQPRLLCDGRVALCVRAASGAELIAYLVDRPSAHWPILRLDNLYLDPKQIDIAPDGSRAAWIDTGRLIVADRVVTDCADLLERLQWSADERD